MTATWGDGRLPERFWAKVALDESGCWLWVASLNSAGYPQIGFGRSAPKLSHRVAYEALTGPIPDGLTIDHLCRKPRCVNPDHLEAVTIQENIRRAAATKTHCKRGHPLSGDNLITLKRGHRRCRKCQYAASARWAARQRTLPAA